MRSINLKTVKNILCIRLDAMGDVLMTTPAFRAIKESLPDSSLTLLTSSEGAAIAQMIPEVDEVITCNVPWEKKESPATSSEILNLVTVLKKKKFDAACIFTVFTQNSIPSALLCYMADIPIRIAFCHKNPNNLLTHWIQDSEPQETLKHEVVRQLELVRLLNCKTSNTRLSLRIPESAKQQVTRILKNNGVDTQNPWLILHPGSTSISRQYSSEGFINAAKKIINDLGYQIIITGSSREAESTKKIKEELGNASYNLAEKLTLEELAALISFSPLLIANNTGPVHMAAAVGTPIVDVYALTNPQHTPWQVPHRVLYFKTKENKFYYTPGIPLSEYATPLINSDDIVKAAGELLHVHNKHTEERIYKSFHNDSNVAALR